MIHEEPENQRAKKRDRTSKKRAINTGVLHLKRNMMIPEYPRKKKSRRRIIGSLVGMWARRERRGQSITTPDNDNHPPNSYSSPSLSSSFPPSPAHHPPSRHSSSDSSLCPSPSHHPSPFPFLSFSPPPSSPTFPWATTAPYSVAPSSRPSHARPRLHSHQPLSSDPKSSRKSSQTQTSSHPNHHHHLHDYDSSSHRPDSPWKSVVPRAGSGAMTREVRWPAFAAA